MIKKHITIAIDGPSGSGKSTLAGQLAKHYGLIHIDTGALYRTIGLFVHRLGIASDDAEKISASLPQIDISMKLVDGKGRVTLDGTVMGEEIRTPIISKYASDVSKIPEVRAFLLELQRSIARENSVVMDGRDIGTVILPDADVKLFLVASDTARAERRCAELKEKGEDVTLQSVLDDMRWRDANDSGRKIAPLVPAEDAIMFDNSVLNKEESFRKAVEIIDGVLK